MSVNMMQKSRRECVSSARWNRSSLLSDRSLYSNSALDRATAGADGGQSAIVVRKVDESRCHTDSHSFTLSALPLL